MLLPLVRADYAAVHDYRHRPGERLHCPVTVIVGVDDPRVSRAEAEAWAEHTAGDTVLRTFPGGHFYLDDHCAEITADIASHVSQLVAPA
jgi:surfactin synthase thioesterase subunit